MCIHRLHVQVHVGVYSHAQIHTVGVHVYSGTCIHVADLYGHTHQDPMSLLVWLTRCSTPKNSLLSLLIFHVYSGEAGE